MEVAVLEGVFDKGRDGRLAHADSAEDGEEYSVVWCEVRRHVFPRLRKEREVMTVMVRWWVSELCPSQKKNRAANFGT